MPTPGPAHYRFSHRADVDASPSVVADVITDLERYPSWWPHVRAVGYLGPDEALVICRSILPYDLELHVRAVSRDLPRLEVAIDGPIRGTASWDLRSQGSGTTMHFRQDVEAVSSALRAASYALRPLLRWNHEVMMRGCVRGLRQALASPS